MVSWVNPTLDDFWQARKTSGIASRLRRKLHHRRAPLPNPRPRAFRGAGVRRSRAAIGSALRSGNPSKTPTVANDIIHLQLCCIWINTCAPAVRTHTSIIRLCRHKVFELRIFLAALE